MNEDVLTEIVDEINDKGNTQREVEALCLGLHAVVMGWRKRRDIHRDARAIEAATGQVLPRTPVAGVPPVVRDVLVRLAPSGGLTEKEGRMLQAAVRRTLESFEEWYAEHHQLKSEI
jgi:hypothetical protein